MTTHRATHRTSGRPMAGFAAFTVAAATAAVVVAVGFGTWQGARPNAATESGHSATEQVHVSADGGASASAGRASMLLTYFLVRSEDDARVVRELLATLGGPEPAIGRPAASNVVLVVGDGIAPPLDSLPWPPGTHVVDARS